MSDIISNLEDLDPEELKAVSNLINKLAKRKNKEPVAEKKVDIQQGRDKPRKSQSSKGRGKQGRSSPKQERAQKPRGVRRNGASRGQAGRTEAVSLSGENKFESMKARNDYKSDSKIDKLLWGDSKPQERPDEFQYEEVQCKLCNKWFDIDPSLVLRDADTRETNFTCDNCVPRGAGE